MLHKQSASQFIASLAAFVSLCSAFPASAQNVQTACEFSQTRACIESPLLLAHHEAASSTVGAVDILGTEPAAQMSGALSDSLWGNLILQMAYARDRELYSSVRKLKFSDNLTLASIYGIAGVSVAQSITGLVTLNPGGGHGTSHNVDTGSEGEHQHAAANDNQHNDSYAPGILGLISSGSTLAALGLRFYFGHRYSKKIKTRQQEIRSRVESILARLEKGESPEQLRVELLPLIGERATREFNQLWRSSHQVASGGVSG